MQNDLDFLIIKSWCLNFLIIIPNINRICLLSQILLFLTLSKLNYNFQTYLNNKHDNYE